MSLVVTTTSSQHWLTYQTSTRQKIQSQGKLSSALLKNTLPEVHAFMLSLLSLGNLKKQSFAQAKFVST